MIEVYYNMDENFLLMVVYGVFINFDNLVGNYCLNFLFDDIWMD